MSNMINYDLLFSLSNYLLHRMVITKIAVEQKKKKKENKDNSIHIKNNSIHIAL